jgi:ectoine hydroxylase-related dioxygenase (phytanoyl-CoA dioxygenase family)
MKNKVLYQNRTLADFTAAFNSYGWIIYENALDGDFVDQINHDLEIAYQVRRKIQEKNGIMADMSGTLHHLLERDNFALKFIEQMYCDKEISYFLGGKYIMNGMNGVFNPGKEHQYLSDVHRDVRTYVANDRTLIQMIVTLDNFGVLNGATHFLSGSHKKEQKPDDDDFFERADRAITSRGSIILFDSNIWHAAGENYLLTPRRALTIGFTRPQIKQQFDYPRYLGYEFGNHLTANQRQIIGYNSRVPENLNEYYQPPHLRMYQCDQG